MFQNAPGRWPSRIVTLLVWVLAGVSLMYWGLKLGGPAGARLNAPVATSGAAQSDPAMVAYLLGTRSQAAVAAEPAPAAPSRFLLAGVIAGHTNQGAALISVDGKPPKPFRVGSQVDTGLVLRSVAPRRAVLATSADGPPAFTLDLPPPKK
jgi:general secretion pathway protein C